MAKLLFSAGLLSFALAGPSVELTAPPTPAAPAAFILQPNAPAKSLRAKLTGGKWKPVALQMGEQKVPPQILAEDMPDHIQFSDDRMTAVEGGKQFANVPYELDETVAPARLIVDGWPTPNAPPNANRKSTVIVRMQGDKLQICLGLDEAIPPADFAPTAEDEDALITYEQVK